MKVQCQTCKHVHEADHLAVRCPECGAKGMTFAPGSDGWKPGEPMVGPSRVPITGGSRSAMRSREQEPVEVTRERRRLANEYMASGVFRDPIAAVSAAILDVPVQCGRCGGDDDGCVVCSGRATAPTEELAARRAPKPARRRRR